MKALAWLLLLARPAWASHEDIGSWASSAGLGDAMTAVSGDLAALDVNPAALGSLDSMRLKTGFRRAFQTGAGNLDHDRITLAAAGPVRWGATHGAMGLTWGHTSLNELSLDRTLGLTYATKGWKEMDAGLLDAGMTLKGLGRSGRAGGGSVTKLAVDVGTLYRLGDHAAVGASILNLNGPRTDVGGLGDRAPVIFKLGYAQNWRGFVLAADFTKREASFGLPSGQSIAAGVQNWWHTARHGSFAARTGLSLGDRSKTWSLGWGWRMLGAEFDYALLIPVSHESRWGHAVSLLLRFGTWNPEREYERMLGSELSQRQELTKSLEAAEVKQWKLLEEMRLLREDVDALRNELALKSASEDVARTRLRAIEERQRKAQQALDAVRREKERLSRMSKESLYREDWGRYAKLKLDGAPDLVLEERVKLILKTYKGEDVDVSEANQELLRLQRSRPAP